MNPTPRKRPTARILVLNNHDQVLLLEIVDPDMPPVHFWVTPGGGLEPGESFEDAAKRELFEETGFIVSNVAKPVWRRHKIVFFSGEWVDAQELTFAVRVDSTEVVRDGFTEQEHSVIRSHRWWSLEELRATSATVFPEHFALRLEPILRGEISSEPIEIGADSAS